MELRTSYKSFENSLNKSNNSTFEISASNSFSSSSTNSSFSKKKKRLSSSFQKWADDVQNKLNTASYLPSESEEFDELLSRKIRSSRSSIIHSIPRHQILNENISLISIPSSSNSSVYVTSAEELSMIHPPEMSVQPFYDTSHLRPPPSYYNESPRITIRFTSNSGPKSLNLKIEKK